MDYVQFCVFAITAVIAYGTTVDGYLIRNRRGEYAHSFAYSSSSGPMPPASSSTARKAITSVCCFPSIEYRTQSQVVPCEPVCEPTGSRTIVIKGIIAAPQKTQYEPPVPIYSSARFSSSHSSFSSGSSYSSTYSVSSGSTESNNGGVRSITLQIPLPALRFGSHAIASQGIVQEIPIPEEFRNYETLSGNIPSKATENIPKKFGPPAPFSSDINISSNRNSYLTFPKQSSTSFTSYGRPSYGEIPFSGTDDEQYGARTEKPSNGYGRPSDLAVEEAQNEVMDAGVSGRNINIDQRTEVAPSELINEIPNDMKRRSRH